MQVGSIIKTRRVLAQFTQEQVARSVGCTPAAISAIERGALRPSPDLLARLAAALSLDLERRK